MGSIRMVRDRCDAAAPPPLPAPLTAAAAATRRARSTHPSSPLSPLLAHETLYVGIDGGTQRHVAGFVSTTLLSWYQRFEGCPALVVDTSREGFRPLADRIRSSTPLEQACCLGEKTGHSPHAIVAYLLELDVSVYVMH